MDLDDLIQKLGLDALFGAKRQHQSAKKENYIPPFWRYAERFRTINKDEDLDEHALDIMTNVKDVRDRIPVVDGVFDPSYQKLVHDALDETYKIYQMPIKVFKFLDWEDGVISSGTLAYQFLRSIVSGPRGEAQALGTADYLDLVYECIPKAIGVAYWSVKTNDSAAVGRFIAIELVSMSPYFGDGLDLMDLYTVYARQKFQDAAVDNILDKFTRYDAKFGEHTGPTIEGQLAPPKQVP